MAPIAKGKAAAAVSRSRNTTPMSATSSAEPGSAVPKTANSPMSYAEISDLCRSSSTPTSAILSRLLDGMRQRSEIAKSRSSHHDTSFRDATKRKDRELDKQHELQVARRREEEEIRARAQSKARTPDPKEVEDDVEMEEEKAEPQRPPTVGVRGVARQDGVPSEGLCRAFLLLYTCFNVEPCSIFPTTFCSKTFVVPPF